MLPKVRELWLRARRYVVATAAIAVVGVLAFLAGRAAAPTRVETRIDETGRARVAQLEQENLELTRQLSMQTDRVVYRTRIVKPDGTELETSREEESVSVEERAEVEHVRSEDLVADARRTASIEQITERALPDWRVGVLVAADVRRLAEAPVFGAHVQRRILGPVHAGAFFLSSGHFGASVSAEF